VCVPSERLAPTCWKSISPRYRSATIQVGAATKYRNLHRAPSSFSILLLATLHDCDEFRLRSPLKVNSIMPTSSSGPKNNPNKKPAWKQVTSWVDTGFFLDLSTLKMEATCYSEAYVDFQLTTRHYISEEGTLHNYPCENLKSYRWLIPCYSTNFVRKDRFIMRFVRYFMTLSVARLRSIGW
jgi:hypothetical protein